MSSQSTLSSEKALDDYFSALLDECVEVEDDQKLVVVSESENTMAEEPEPEPEPELQRINELTEYTLPVAESEVPNLEDVERLLLQLESTNPVDELDIEQVLQKNTDSIAVVKTEQAVEEIQEWEVDATPISEVTTPELDIEFEESQSSEIEIPQTDEQTDISVALETQSQGSVPDVWQTRAQDVQLQVLYFDVNGVTFAVPLDELGGIHRLGELSHLIGRPAWYLGLQSNKEAQLDVVDTAKWVMPEKLKGDAYKEAYQYIVMLGESMWGLASTQLMGTESLNPDMIRWRETAGKRPWLAGMVKEKMCALIHVDALISMLDAGLDVKALNH
ncbi:chemotaxis protein CheW [Vibrio japonicus]|uniref:Chemotaxis protein CheW n=1 Tax=Vibrio japonicus TaxID=1824638 RepID=A0ABY5LJ35_9VIBR|nr:chemotaxis protein CheW [Vibrio japonicus]UUM29795.1 chemotaxis protein CheW [Vibrio japonicus]